MEQLTAQLAGSPEFISQTLSEERIFVWQENINSLFDLSATSATCSSDLHEYLTSPLPDQKLLIHSGATPARVYTRSALQVAQDGVDHYMIQTHRTGSQVVTLGDQQLHVSPGDLFIVDLSEPYSTITTDSSSLSLLIPRKMLATGLLAPDSQHCRILSNNNPLTSIAVSHLIMLGNCAGRMSTGQGAWLIEPTLALLTCVMNGTTDHLQGANQNFSRYLLLQIRQFLDSRLAGALSAALICQHFRISRSTLHRLFEPLGGFKHYIQERRLRQSVKALLDAEQGRIIDIACQYGFRSEAHFSRAIRLKYGTTPSGLRAMKSKRKKQPPDSGIS